MSTTSQEPLEPVTDAVSQWASTHLGPVRVVADRSRRDRALVVEVEDRGGGRWFVKRPKGAPSFRREVRAYRRFVAPLAVAAPQLVAASSAHGTLLLSGLAGRGAEELDLRLSAAVHRRAGSWLAQLHGAAAPAAAPGLGADLAGRVTDLVAAGRELVDDATVEYLSRVAERFAEMTGLQVVPCHLDYSQRNWIVDDGGGLGVIDFSASDLALVATDLARLANRQWSVRPDLRDAFLEGYGRELTEEEHEQLECCTALAAMSALVRTRSSPSPVLRTKSQRTLRTLRAATPPRRASSPPVRRALQALSSLREATRGHR